MKTEALALAAALAALLPVTAVAQEALYDPAPPPNSAFVRFVDAARASASGSVDGTELDVSGDGVSSFVVVPAGAHRVALGSTSGEATFDAGNYYTVVFNEAGASGPAIIRDDVLTNPAKAGLHFYNLSGKPGLSLTAPKQNVAIFEQVGPGEMKFRPVGAVDVDLAVTAAGETLADVGSVKLERRAAKSVIVLASADGVETVVVDNTVER
jgi:alginate O-acetyltransferase complex protein AlgF